LSNPTVSIITATFNRSNVLRLTIEAVRASSFTDWELIVIGDACTDDTEEVVLSFRDPRITFFNLPRNSGEQATPNNAGFSHARGRYVAFLNHDDFWAKDHLETCLEAMAGADLVTAVTVAIDHHRNANLMGVSSSGSYVPWVFYPVSSWLIRRELAARVSWRPARDLHLVPSQDWLFRAWKSGATMRSTGRATVIAIGSNGRSGSYSERQIDEYSRMAELMADPDLVPRLLAPTAFRLTAEFHGATPTALISRAFRIIGRRALIAAGIHPHSVWQMFKLRRKGALLDQMRRTRGLSPLPRGESQ
jgi:glycosyltransferase involved in cell wall biosynthesis